MLSLDAETMRDSRIESGALRCMECTAVFAIVHSIPRFVEEQHYTEAFGLQWNLHSRTQYDENSGLRLSEDRFMRQTGWPRDLEGQVIVEVGSGSGRFTTPALSTGATVLSLDYSRAVDANYASNGDNNRLLLVQGSLFEMPFREGLADRLFCFGVLQHTPDPERAIHMLAAQLRIGGELAADIYPRTFSRYILGTKYWIRGVTRRVPSERLHQLTTRYVDAMWPLARRIRRIPRIGRALNWRLLIADHSDEIQDDEVLHEWARLDTFDMLAPTYDKPARERTLRRWCEEAGLSVEALWLGHNGFEFRARRVR